VAAAPAFDLFTLAYVFDPEQAVSMASAGADCIVAHVGWTAGGLVGAGSAAAGVDAAHERIEQICAAARGERPDVICLAHGGPIATPADTESLYRATTVDGFVGASSVERIPVEEAVTRTVQAFKSVPLRAST
jgi:predicted TIM-barrel enzyme